MISRAATAGRGVAVRPTERAAENLSVLRAAWSRELSRVIGDDLGGVHECIDLLTRIEQRFTAAGDRA